MEIIGIRGWGMCGSAAREYSAELTAEKYEGMPVVHMWSSSAGEEVFGAMFQMFKADRYRGKRVRLSAAMRTVEITDRAALCFRVDGPESGRTLAFDNMDNRPRITGTTEWARYSCVLDVPEKAASIFISNILSGRGELFWSDVRFEAVDESVPTTEMNCGVLDEPTNLDFSEE